MSWRVALLQPQTTLDNQQVPRVNQKTLGEWCMGAKMRGGLTRSYWSGWLGYDTARVGLGGEGRAGWVGSAPNSLVLRVRLTVVSP
jgi:hypothetical protein